VGSNASFPRAYARGQILARLRRCVDGEKCGQQFVEKLFYVVILSEAKDLLVMPINNLEILRRPLLLRMTAPGQFFNKLLTILG